ncbi:MAG TPA: TetR/AcrR family transcriptional regulator, partial [Candidatus Omnitrophota bacterium]|nr:TetR/AcrR family transcriptional regulator [Candidatus Omnitrophota bacterium]
EAILDAAQEAFLESGYANTSMDTVASRAGVSKATIYAHFKGKDELFGAIILRKCETHIGMGAIPDIETLDARSAMTAMGSHLMRLLLLPEALGVYRIVVAEALRQPDLVRAYTEAGPVRGKTNMVKVLTGLVERGELVIDDCWRAADLFIGMLRGECYNRALLGMPPVEGLTVEASIEAAVEVFMRAYGAQ